MIATLSVKVIVSAFLFTPSAVARESFASQLWLPTALTLGRFASNLCLCLCLCFACCSECMCVTNDQLMCISVKGHSCAVAPQSSQPLLLVHPLHCRSLPDRRHFQQLGRLVGEVEDFARTGHLCTHM